MGMRVDEFTEILGAEFYTGVPDSQLQALCNYLMWEYGIDPRHHVIAANEGNCVALAAGYHLATGKIPVVYMQNSGEGNIINPIVSLLHREVYAIPMVFVIGWRGEPGIHDEPQHVYQGRITMKLLENMEIPAFVVGKDTTAMELLQEMEKFSGLLAQGRNVAFVIRKGSLVFDRKMQYKNLYPMAREDVIRHILSFSGNAPVVSTTGKASRELYEIREANGQGHERDFLTVGSMGHSSSIALGIALARPDTKVWCIDGDGAVLMHMGAMAVLGACAPKNLIHIVLNNIAHETVGGMPTVAGSMNLTAVASACGYTYVESVDGFDDLDRKLALLKERQGLSFLEIKCALGARSNLGRPRTAPIDNKTEFMKYLAQL